MIQNTIIKYGVFALIGVGLFIGGTFVGCKSFSPVNVMGYSQECNDKLSMMKFMVLLDIKDTGVLKSEQDKCSATREIDIKIKVREQCRKEAFGDKNPIDKTKYTQYTQYLECLQNISK